MQVSRLVKRDTCSREQAEAKVKAQMPLNTKQAKAHIVIDNSKDLEHMEGQVLPNTSAY